MPFHVYIHVYKRTPIYNFPHCSCFIKDVDLFMRSIYQPGIRAWELPAIHPAPNDRKNEDNTLLKHQSKEKPHCATSVLTHLEETTASQWCLLQAIRTPIHC